MALLAGCAVNGPGASTGSLGADAGKPSVKVALLVPLSSQGQPGLIA
jgi:hypothetical protein